MKNQEYWMKVCERDADWQAYCENPTDSNWKLFAETDKAMNVASLTMQLERTKEPPFVK